MLAHQAKAIVKKWVTEQAARLPKFRGAFLIFSALLLAACAVSPPSILTAAPPVPAVAVPSLPAAVTLPPPPSPTVTSSPAPTFTQTPQPTVTPTPPPYQDPFPTPFEVQTLTSAASLRIAVQGNAQPVGGVAWAPGGGLLAIAVGETVRLYDAATFVQTGTLPVGSQAGLLAFNPAGDRLAVVRAGGGRDSVQVWDWAARRRLAEFALDTAAVPTAAAAAVGAEDQHALPPPNLTPQTPLQVDRLAYGPGKILAANFVDHSDPNQVQRVTAAWQVESGAQIFASRSIASITPRTLDFSPDEARLLHPVTFGFQLREARTGQVISEHPDSGAEMIYFGAGSAPWLYFLRPSGLTPYGTQAFSLTRSTDLIDTSPLWPEEMFAGAPDAPLTNLVESGPYLAALADGCSSTHRLDVWILDTANDQPFTGRLTGRSLTGLPGGCDSIALSDDARRLAFVDGRDVWVWELAR